MFQHTAARRRLPFFVTSGIHRLGVSTHSRPKAAAATAIEREAKVLRFQHTAARRRLHNPRRDIDNPCLFQHTAARRRLHVCAIEIHLPSMVSTHSRPKAAAPRGLRPNFLRYGFNTQPPEGGCIFVHIRLRGIIQFQHTAARRRLQRRKRQLELIRTVSTHSRPKAAAQTWKFASPVVMVSTHSRPKAAAREICVCKRQGRGFQHTAARRRLPKYKNCCPAKCKFQHTAARRRLPPIPQLTITII